jgi:hypothetical protein
VFPPGLILDPLKIYGVYLYLDNAGSFVNFNRNTTGGGSPQPHVVFKNFDGDNLFHALQGTPFSYNSQSDIDVRALIGSSDLHLVFDQDIYLEIKGLAYTDNTIDVSESPIVFTADGEVAYVIPNLTTGGPTLTVTVDTLDQVPANGMVIARRDNGEIIVGSSSTRLKLGQSTELYAQESIQTRNTVRSTDFLRSDNPVTWTGSDLIFSSDIVLETINTRLGANDQWTIALSQSPISLADGEIAYIEIDREDPTGSATVVIDASVPTVASENIEYIIIGKRVDANGAGYLHIPLHKQVLEPGQTVQLGASGAGDGGGNEILESLKNHLMDSFYELVTPNIFKVDKDDKVDVSSTGEYSLVDRSFNMDSGETMVSTNMLDTDEFDAEQDSISEIELLVYWRLADINTNATYEVSRSGLGAGFQTVTMERVGLTDLYRGVLEFDTETNVSLASNATGAASVELNASSQQRLSQKVILATNTIVRAVDLTVTKAGSPDGYLAVSIVKDDGADKPSLLSSDIYCESAPIAMSSISTGTLAVSLPEVVLPAGSYHIVLRTIGYTSTFITTTKSLSWDSESSASAPFLTTYNGSVWAVSTSKAKFDLKGISLDLRVRVTSVGAASKLEGYGLFYNKTLSGKVADGQINVEVFEIDGDDDETEFTLSKFMPHPDLLKVYDVNSGQVYTYGAFALDGHKVIFESGQFYSPGETIKLRFMQVEGTVFDGSDANAALLAANFLGSTDPSIDRSQNGRGIFLRRPDGTLREITIDNSDNIVIYSV